METRLDDETKDPSLNHNTDRAGKLPATVQVKVKVSPSVRVVGPETVNVTVGATERETASTCNVFTEVHVQVHVAVQTSPYQLQIVSYVQ